jgi:hypothetical protein
MSLKKQEGVASLPWPVEPPAPENLPVRLRLALSKDPREPRCEMCGSVVIATHCKRICLHCGFMTGCSEGI